MPITSYAQNFEDVMLARAFPGATVASLELVCQPELRAFYRRWGFSENVGRSALMRRPSTTASAAT